MAENFPTDRSDNVENDRSKKLSRIQKMLASLLKRERKVLYEITEDTISARSSIQFVTSSVVFGTQTSDDNED